MTPIRAVIFDMDGIMIDTEPLWREAEIESFGCLGVRLTDEQCMETMGVRVQEVVELRYRQHPWEAPTTTEVAREIEDRVIERVLAEGASRAGLRGALGIVRDAGLRTAIASSSSERLIQAVVERLGIGDCIEVICSADAEPEGKPHPGVYLTAARLLSVPPAACLAVEDSPNGVLAAKAAGMACIAVPDENLREDARFAAADLRLASLEKFTEPVLARFMAAGEPVQHR